MVTSSLGGGEDFMEEAHLNRIWPSKCGEEETEVMGRVQAKARGQEHMNQG